MLILVFSVKNDGLSVLVVIIFKKSCSLADLSVQFRSNHDSFSELKRLWYVYMDYGV